MADTDTKDEKRGKGGARAEIKIEGPVASTTVDDALKLRAEQETPDRARERHKFHNAVKDPNVRIVAKRLSPARTNDGKPLGDEYELHTHDEMTEGEIITDIQQSRGGSKWHVRCEDKDTGEQLCAKTIKCGGTPVLDPFVEDADPLARGGGGWDPAEEEVEEPTAEEQVAKQIALDPDVIEAKKQAELLKLENARMKLEADKEELDARKEESRTRRDRARRGILEGDQENGRGKKEDDMQAAIEKAVEAATGPLNDELKRYREKDDRRDSDESAERRIQTHTGPINQTLEAMQKTLDKMAEGPKEDKFAQILTAIQTSNQSVADAIKDSNKEDPNRVMADAIKDMSTQLGTHINNMQTNLITALGNKNDPATDALVKLATREPGGAQPTDPFSMMDKMTNSMKNLVEVKTGMEGKGGEIMPPDFPSYMVAKVSEMTEPVLDFMDKQASRGEKVTKEMMTKFMHEQGVKMYQELDTTIKNEVRGGMHRLAQLKFGDQTVTSPAGQVPPMPAPVAVAAAPPPAGATLVGTAAPQPVVAAAPAADPNAPPVAGAAPAPAPVAAPPQAAAAPAAAPPAAAPAATDPAHALQVTAPALETDIRHRVHSVLSVVLQEMQLGVNTMSWPQMAFDHLPKDIRDRLVAASEDTHVYDAVRPWADPILLDQIWAYMSETHPNYEWYRKWMTVGLDWIKVAASGNVPVVEDQ